MGSDSGTLTIMVGATKETWPKVESISRLMGKQIIYAGEAGAGSASKILNNYLSAVNVVATSEVLNMGTRYGLDPKRLSDIINVSGGQNWILTNLNPCPAAAIPGTAPARGYTGGFAIELCRDVFELGINISNATGSKSIIGPAVQQAFQEAAQDPRCKGLDARSIYRYISDTVE
jgi:3-hydroxyisobutyrate dehydrogenase-like beta-hydroxyacid dehydrogenase